MNTKSRVALSPLENLALAFQASVDRNGDQTSFVFLSDGENQEEVLSFKELGRRATSIASALASRFPPGSRIGIVLDTGLDFPCVFWGCVLAGMTAVPVYPPIDPNSLSSLALLRVARVSTVVSTRSWIGKLGENARNWISIEDLESAPVAEFPPLALTTTSPALLQFTSGSTASPRGTVVTHLNLLRNVDMIASLLRSGKSAPSAEVLVSWLPLYHDMGLVGGVVSPVLLGAKSVLLSPWMFLQKPARWLRAISKYRATVSAAPNFGYELCLKRVKDSELAALDLSSWTLAFNGAEAVWADTIRKFQTRFQGAGFSDTAFLPTYGLAEATLLVTGPGRGRSVETLMLARGPLEERKIEPASGSADGLEVVSCGETWGDEELRIVDPETLRLLPENEIGEIWLRGSNVAPGYFDQESSNFSVFQAKTVSEPDVGSAFLRTGDLGFVRGKNLFVTGRLKETIVIRGRNFAPQDLERSLVDLNPFFRTGCTAAIGVARSGTEELILLQEIVQESAGFDPGSAEQAVRSAVATRASIAPTEVHFLRAGSLPKTSSGKLQRTLTRKKFLEGGLLRWQS